MKCRTCNKKLGKTNKDLPNGTIQRGQGRNKPLLTFCNRKCVDKYIKYKEKGWIWKLKGINPWEKKR